MTNPDSETSQADQYLVWMWQRYALSLFQCDSLEDAVRMSEAIQDNGDGSLQCIEGPEGIVSDEAVDTIVDQLRADERARVDESPKYTHYIRLQSPSGKEAAQWDWYTSREDAEAAFGSLSARFGGRVSLNEVKGA